MAKEDFLEVSDDIILFIKNIEKDFNLPLDISYKYIINKKQKQLIKFVKIPDIYGNENILNADILITVNEDYFNNFDNETKKILIEKEFDRINFNFEKGLIKLVNPKINVSNGFVEKYTWEKVSDAINLQEEFEKQRNDKN